MSAFALQISPEDFQELKATIEREICEISDSIHAGTFRVEVKGNRDTKDEHRVRIYHAGGQFRTFFQAVPISVQAQLMIPRFAEYVDGKSIFGLLEEPESCYIKHRTKGRTQAVIGFIEGKDSSALEDQLGREFPVHDSNGNIGFFRLEAASPIADPVRK